MAIIIQIVVIGILFSNDAQYGAFVFFLILFLLFVLYRRSYSHYFKSCYKICGNLVTNYSEKYERNVEIPEAIACKKVKLIYAYGKGGTEYLEFFIFYQTPECPVADRSSVIWAIRKSPCIIIPCNPVTSEYISQYFDHP